MARILIADDDADIRQLLIYALAEDGHAISVAKDGGEAIEAVAGERPDLLILDVMMPGKDGYVVMEELNERGMRDATKVLMLTAKISERDWQRGFEVGADRYMTKPFDSDELLECVRELLTSDNKDLAEQREQEYERARLLSQLETIFGPE